MTKLAKEEIMKRMIDGVVYEWDGTEFYFDGYRFIFNGVGGDEVIHGFWDYCHLWEEKKEPVWYENIDKPVLYLSQRKN